jgi:SOS response regulatory protein OraA/RecX
VKFELGQKGISKEIIEKALEDFDLEKKEDLLLNRLIEKKWKTVSKNPKEKQYEKMMRFVLSKGFDYETAKKEVENKMRKNHTVS